MDAAHRALDVYQGQQRSFPATLSKLLLRVLRDPSLEKCPVALQLNNDLLKGKGKVEALEPGGPAEPALERKDVLAKALDEELVAQVIWPEVLRRLKAPG